MDVGGVFQQELLGATLLALFGTILQTPVLNSKTNNGYEKSLGLAIGTGIIFMCALVGTIYYKTTVDAGINIFEYIFRYAPFGGTAFMVLFYYFLDRFVFSKHDSIEIKEKKKYISLSFGIVYLLLWILMFVIFVVRAERRRRFGFERERVRPVDQLIDKISTTTPVNINFPEGNRVDPLTLENLVEGTEYVEFPRSKTSSMKYYIEKNKAIQTLRSRGPISFYNNQTRFTPNLIKVVKFKHHVQ